MARLVSLVATLLLVTACIDGRPAPEEGPRAEDPTTTTTLPATTTTAVVTTTTEPPAEPVEYLVVAEEAARRLAVIGRIDGPDPCEDAEPSPCGPFQLVATYELSHRPHNLAAQGSVVLATHWREGTMSRLEVATGDLLTARVGLEPHDVKIAGGVAYVADDAGRALLIVDPMTLDVLESIPLPHRPHDLYVDGETVWVTMLGTDRLAVVADGEVTLVPTGRAPHDLIVTEGRVWFTNWNSPRLDVLDVASGEVAQAPAGVMEPHHFALDESGRVWVTDHGGDSVVVFGAEIVSVVVGHHPHHLVRFGSTMAVAVSGSGEAVFVADERVVGRVPLSAGLHGVAVVVLAPGTSPGST